MAEPRKRRTPEEQEVFNEQVQRRLEDGLTLEQIAEELNVSEKTVLRAKSKNKAAGRVLKKEIPSSQAMRDKLFEEHLDTFAVIKAAIRRTERYQDALERELGFEAMGYDAKGNPLPCPTCNRFPMKTSDPLKWQAAFKGGESINAQVTTLAKMQGQLADNVVMVINQIDEDLMLILNEISKVDKALAQQIFNQLISVSQRRRNRLPEFGRIEEIVEAQYRLLPGE